MKTYTFDLVVPKGWENKYITTKAKNKQEAKRKLLVEMHKINKKRIKVVDYDKKIKMERDYNKKVKDVSKLY